MQTLCWDYFAIGTPLFTYKVEF